MEDSVSLLIITGLLLLSAFFSGSETAFFSLSKVQLKKMENQKKGQKHYKRILRLLKKPKELLILILFGNTIVNVLASTTAAVWAINLSSKFFKDSLVFVILFEIIVMTIVILIIGEVIPKLVAIASPVKFAQRSAFFLEILRMILWPIIKILEFISNIFTSKHKEENLITTSDVRELINSEISKDSLEEEDKKILMRIFRLNKTIAEEIMIPRVDITAIEQDDPLSKLKEIITESGYSKIPVYKEDIDEIIGFIYAKDIILYPERKYIKQLMRMPLIVPEKMAIITLFNMFKMKKVHIAIVVDEYGGTSGLITLEDIFEEIVGEIEDEYDDHELPSIRKTGENKYLLNSMLSIKELNEELELNLPEDEFNNVAEFIFAQLDRIPKRLESFIYNDNLKFTIIKLTSKRIIDVELEILNRE